MSTPGEGDDSEGSEEFSGDEEQVQEDDDRVDKEEHVSDGVSEGMEDDKYQTRTHIDYCGCTVLGMFYAFWYLHIF